MDFIHKFVPAQTNEDKATLVLLHGTGGNEEDLLDLGAFLAPGSGLLGVRGKVLEQGAPRFFRRLAEGVFDEQDLIFRTRELAGFLRDAAENYRFQPDKLLAVGYSNGANIAAGMLLLEPDVLAGAVLLRAMVPLEQVELPRLDGKPVLMLCGRQDPLIPQTQSERLAQMLEEAGANVTLQWANTGHGLTNAEVQTARSWVGQLKF